MRARSVGGVAAILVALIAWIGASPSFARDAAGTLADAKAAAGGNAWDNVKAIRLIYVLRQNGLEGTGETLVELTTGRSVTRYRLGPLQGAEGDDGHGVWVQDTAGLVTVPRGGDTLARAVSARYRNSLAYWYPARASARTDARLQLFRMRVKEAVAVTPPGGVPFELWFDAQTKYLERVVEESAAETRITMFEDYRKIAGLAVPHVIRSSNAAEAFGAERLVTKVEIDPPVSDADFAPPADPPPDYAFANAARRTAVPFRFTDNHVYVDVKLNGRLFPLLVDTGAANVITPTTARVLGLKSVGDARVRGTGEGSESAAFTKIANVAIGGVTLRNQLFAVVPLEKLAEVEGAPFHGIVGYELFKRLTVTLDYDARQMILNGEHGPAPERATAVPFAFNGTVPEVEGTIDGIPATFEIDTGSRVAVSLNSPFVQLHALRARFNPSVEAVTGWGIGGPSRGTIARVKQMSLGPLQVGNVIADMSLLKQGASSHTSPAGNIGSGLLKRYVVTFDYRRQQILFEDRGARHPHEPFDRSGLWVNADPSGYRIEAIVKGSPAEVAGLRLGDIITAVDGAATLTLSAMRDRLRETPPGTTLRLTIRRGGALSTVALTLRDVI